MTEDQVSTLDATFPSPQMPKSDIAQLYVSSNVKIQPMNKTKPSSVTNLNKIHEAKTTSTALPQDIIGTIIGDFGVWQLRTVLIIFLCKIPAAWFMACIIFTAPAIEPNTEFQCDTLSLKNNHSITFDQCYINEYIVGEEMHKTPCQKFRYNYHFMSLVMQFDLVCFRDIYVAWTQYWHLFGVLVGGVVGTKMMLWFSPRNSYCSSMIFQIIMGIATGYARDLTLHCVFRFLAAVACAVMFTTGQAIFMDLIGGPYRWGVVILYDTFWSIGVILLPGVSAFYQHWTHLYLGITFPTLLLILLLQWTPESPRWLLKNGSAIDVERVENLVLKAAKINDRLCKVPTDLRTELENLRDKLRKSTPPAAWCELWSGHQRAKVHMIAAHLALAAYVVNFMGLLLNIRSFGRECRTISTVTMGFCEIVGCFLALHMKRKLNDTKFQWAGFLNIIGGLIACLGWAFSNVNPSLEITLWLLISGIPKVTVACAQSLLLACLAELMPPNKKMPFVFSAVTWARIWLLTAPFINVLKKFDTALSLSAFGVLIIIGGVSTCLLRPVKDLTSDLKTPTAAKQAQPLLEKHESPLNTTVWVFDADGHDIKNNAKV